MKTMKNILIYDVAAESGGALTVLKEYYERAKHGIELTIFGMKRANDGQLPVYEAILSDLKEMEERIYGNRT